MAPLTKDIVYARYPDGTMRPILTPSGQYVSAQTMPTIGFWSKLKGAIKKWGVRRKRRGRRVSGGKRRGVERWFVGEEGE
jgi:hypothetical protein